MLDSDVIEIALGLIFVFILFSLLVSAANEALVGLLGSRATTLWHGVERMLGSEAAKGVFDHALIRSVTPPSSWSRSTLQVFGAGSRRGPTYIDARTFATALLDVLKTPHAPIGAIEGELTRTIAELGRGDLSGLSRLSAVLGTASQLPDTPLGQAIRREIAPLQQLIAAGGATAPQVQASAALVLQTLPAHWRAALAAEAGRLSSDLGTTVKALADNATGGIVELRQEIARWFDESMDAVSGWYKRWTMWVQVVIGLVLAVALNVDALRIVQELDRNDALRQAMAARAQAHAGTASDPDAEFKAIEAQLARLGLPIGWDAAAAANPGLTGLPLALKVTTWWMAFGWLLTALAGSLGAPFWFDLLKQVSNLRAAGPNPAEKKTGT